MAEESRFCATHIHYTANQRVFQTLETENSYYMAMELCAGGDLMDRICDRKRLEEREVRRYTRQILSAVEHLHKHGVVHRWDHTHICHRKALPASDWHLIQVMGSRHCRKVEVSSQREEEASMKQSYCL